MYINLDIDNLTRADLQNAGDLAVLAAVHFTFTPFHRSTVSHPFCNGNII
jgi:hypothetical protein